MQNVVAEVQGSVLILKVDLTKDLGPSKSGRTTVVATSRGNQQVGGKPGVYFGLNVYRK